MSGHVVGSAFDFLSSPDFLVQGVLATRRERLAAFRRLYACQWTCQTIFQRALSSVAQNYVVRLLCVTEPVQVELVDKWIMPGSASEQKHREALWQLQRLCVVVPAEILVEDSEEALPDHLLPPRLQDSEAGILLNPVFQKKLRAQLFAIETPLEEGALDWTQEDYMATERASRGGFVVIQFNFVEGASRLRVWRLLNYLLLFLFACAFVWICSLKMWPMWDSPVEARPVVHPSMQLEQRSLVET